MQVIIHQVNNTGIGIFDVYNSIYITYVVTVTLSGITDRDIIDFVLQGNQFEFPTACVLP